MSINWDEEFDVVVVGSGAGGLTAGLTAELKGLSTIVLEKTDVFGGSTAKSGGTIWMPNNLHLNDKVTDTNDNAKKYLDATIGDRVLEKIKEDDLKKVPEMHGSLHTYTTIM